MKFAGKLALVAVSLALFTLVTGTVQAGAPGEAGVTPGVSKTAEMAAGCQGVRQPTVAAWAPRIVNLGSYVTLSSCASDPDGHDVRFAWSGRELPNGRAISGLPGAAAIRWHASRAGRFVFTLQATGSCGATVSDEVTIVVNRPPTVRLSGPRIATAGSLVEVSATACDPDGDSLSYAWAQVGGTGPALPLCSDTGSNIQFTVPEAGTYVVSVFVRDGRGGAATASLTVASNSPPTASADAPPVVYAGRPVSLRGCGYDQDGDALSFAWDRHPTDPGTGPAVAFNSRCGRFASFTPRVAGTYNFLFTVTDSCQATATSSVTVTVLERENRPPQATAEPIECATAGVWTQIRATASDPDEDRLTYRWASVSGPSRPSLRNTCTLAPGFSASRPGVYTLELTVSDGQGGVAKVRTTVSVDAPPVVSIRGELTGEAGTPLVLTGTATDADDSVLTYRWCRVGGSASPVSFDGADTPRLTFRATTPGTYVLRLTVSDGRCATGSARVSVRVDPRGVHARASLGESAVAMMDVTTWTLSNTPAQETVESTSPSPQVTFNVVVTEGRTRRIVGIDTRLTLVNSGAAAVPVTAVAMVVKYRSPECGWILLGPALLGDRAPLRDCTGTRHGSLTMYDAAGNPLTAGSLPVLAGRSTATFRLAGSFDVTCLGFQQNTPVTIGVWASFAEDALRCTCRERGHGHFRSSVWAMERSVAVGSVVRLNERVLLTDLLSSMPDAGLASLGTLTVRGVLASGASVTGSIGVTSSLQETIAATGRAGSRSVFVVSGPVQFATDRCGSTPAATTAALVGTGTAPEGLATIFGNPAIASVSLIARSCPPDPGNEIAAGDFVTYTQGGWGSRAHGNNPGTIRDAGFSTAFPAGLLMGGRVQVVLSTSEAVEEFLPQGGTPGTFTTSALDPLSTGAGVLGGQLAAVSLNVAFSAAGRLGQRDPMPLGQLTIASGPFTGMTVAAFLDLANRTVGGDSGALPPGTTLSDVNDAAARINECFDNGSISTGFLRRP
ncbi:MAG: PKD domain-containing protein [Candidatus Riflebacteria bacterium]|nr:PKD domain-containing protein [Candidatus Riflebacteria bacterium]